MPHSLGDWWCYCCSSVCIDLGSNAILYRMAVTKVENSDAPFEVGKPVHFCPGSAGGAEWNGAAYDPLTNLSLIGEVEWRTTVTLQSKRQLENPPVGKPWSGEASWNPYSVWGKGDAFGDWAGWVYAVDADNYPYYPITFWISHCTASQLT